MADRKFVDAVGAKAPEHPGAPARDKVEVVALKMGFYQGHRVPPGAEFFVAADKVPSWAALKADTMTLKTGTTGRKPTNGDTKPADAAKASKAKAEGFGGG